MNCDNIYQHNIMSPSPPPSDTSQGNDDGNDHHLNRNGSVYNTSTTCSPSTDHHTSSSPPPLPPKTLIHVHRALPAIPGHSRTFKISNRNNNNQQTASISSQTTDAKAKSTISSMERLKDCGWYWGPLSKECAGKLLESEPNGSFLIRDSSNQNYIFTLTSKSNDEIIHTRIEHSQGNFSFGAKHKFSSNTIVDFIEELIEHSQSGTLLFFIHRDFTRQGPIRLKLTNPVSRFRELRSLKHMSRFIILRYVRRDHICLLPLPEPLKVYLCDPCYYSEIDPNHHTNNDDNKYT